jgi:hypothetical protein
MASSKDMQPSVRPLTQQRPSVSTIPSSGLPSRQSHTRNNSHSLLTTGSLNTTHRVTRRKSVTNPAANVAAIAAALRDGDSPAMPIANASRRKSSSKSAAARTSIVSSLPSPPASLPSHAHKAMVDAKLQELNIEQLFQMAACDRNDGCGTNAARLCARDASQAKADTGLPDACQRVDNS